MQNQEYQDPIKVEIIKYVLEALSLDIPKLRNYMEIRYGVSPQIIEEIFYDACFILGNKYLMGTFSIKHSKQANSKSHLAVITSEEVITPNSYYIGAIQLAQLRSWVWKAVRYRTVDYLKKNDIYIEVSLHEIESFIPLDDQSNPEEMHIANEITQLIEEGEKGDQLKNLTTIMSSIILNIRSPREKAIINLTFFSNMTVKEIAKHLGISESNVRSTKSRGLKRIKTQLEQHPEFRLA